jgi:hypothetical protein
MADPTLSESTVSIDHGDYAAQEAHFTAALEAAMKEVPPPDKEPEAEKVTGQEVAIAVEEQRQADAEKEANATKVEPAKTEPEKAPEPELKLSPGTLGKARRLLAEGDVNGALELALGINLEKIEPTTKQWKGVKRIAESARAEAAQAREFAEKEIASARHVVTTLQPFVQAAQAYLKGDYRTFLELATGDTPEKFQQKLINSLHEAPKSDPAMVARLEQLERERVQERQAWKAEQERMAAQNAQMQYAQQVQAWKGGIAEELKTAENPVLAKLATKPRFIEQVFAVQQQYLDARTRSTIDTLEAAEMVYDEFYSGLIDSQPAGGQAGSTQTPRVNGAATGQPGTSVVGKTTSLRHTQATEASPSANLPWSPENQEKLLEEAVRKAKSAIAA